MEQKYNGYVLKATTIRGKPEVAVLLGKERVEIVGGETMDAALASARAFVDDRRAEDAKKRSNPRVATTEEFIGYLKAHPLQPYEEAMLKANAARPLTATQIAAAAGWDSNKGANAWYGTLGGKVGRTIGVEFDRYKNGDEFLMGALVKELDQRDPETGHMVFEMHPELVAALKTIGLV